MSAPVVILVEPQLAENIGMTARAMANFGLSDLRLVAPRNGWPKKGVREAPAVARTRMRPVGTCGVTLAVLVQPTGRWPATMSRTPPRWLSSVGSVDAAR